MSEYLQKIVYLTKSQYDTLAADGTVGGQTGLKDNYLYVTSDTFDIDDMTGILPTSKGGTGTGTNPSQWGIIYASTTQAYASTSAGTAGYLLQSNASSAPTWIQATNSNTASTIVKRDSSGGFSAGTITANLTGFIGKGTHTAAVTANEFTPGAGMLTVVGNVSNTTMTHTSNANAEMIVKAHPTSGSNYYEARLGFSSNGNLYYMPVNTTSWKTVAYTDSNITGNASTATNATNDSDGNAINSTYFKLTETRAATTSNTFAITNNTDASSTATGAFKVSGGVGIAKKLYVGSNTDIAAQTIIHNEVAHSTAGKSSQLVVQNAKDASGNYVAIELLRGSTLNTTYTSWQIAIENSGDLHIRNNYNAAGTGLVTTYAKDLLYIDRQHGTLKIGDLSIGGESGTALGRTISSSNVLYLNRPTANSLVFQHGGTAKMRIDTTNAFRPETTNTLSIGTSNYRWGALYLGTADSYGGYGKPIYWNNGVPTDTFPSQYTSWTITSGNTSVTITKTGKYFSDTKVIALVVTSGEDKLNAPLNWETNTNTLVISTNVATSGTVTGYAITARVDDFSI